MNSLTNEQVVACKKLEIHLKVMSQDSFNMMGREWKRVGLNEEDFKEILRKIKDVYGKSEEIPFRDKCRDLGVKIREVAVSSSGDVDIIAKMVEVFVRQNLSAVTHVEVPPNTFKGDCTKNLSSGQITRWSGGESVVA